MQISERSSEQDQKSVTSVQENPYDFNPYMILSLKDPTDSTFSTAYVFVWKFPFFLILKI